MKKRVIGLLLALLVCLCACGAAKPQTPEVLIGSYLTAVAKEDYEAVLGMLPEEIVTYGMEYLEGGKQDVLDYIEYALNDYYWLVKADLPRHPDFTWQTTDCYEYSQEEIDRLRKNLEREGWRLPLRGVAEAEAEINTGSETVKGSFYMIELGDGWYLISVAGDDEVFKY